MTEQELREFVARQKAWLVRSQFRIALYKAIRLSQSREPPVLLTRAGAIASGCKLITSLSWHSGSGKSNACSAIRQMILHGFLLETKDRPKRLMVGGPVADAIEEAGDGPLLKQEWPI